MGFIGSRVNFFVSCKLDGIKVVAYSLDILVVPITKEIEALKELELVEEFSLLVPAEYIKKGLSVDASKLAYVLGNDSSRGAEGRVHQGHLAKGLATGQRVYFYLSEEIGIVVIHYLGFIL
jgi:hypothetical protein